MMQQKCRVELIFINNYYKEIYRKKFILFVINIYNNNKVYFKKLPKTRYPIEKLSVNDIGKDEYLPV